MSGSRPSRVLLGALALAAALAPGPGQAATPAAGTLSAANPRVDWTGQVLASGAFYNAWDVDRSLRCIAPACDPYVLTVAEPSDLVVIGLNVGSATATGEEGGGGIRVEHPDGSVQWAKGDSAPETTLRLRLADVQPGAYEVTSVASYVCCGPAPYAAHAELPGAAAVAPPPGPAPTPPGPPGPAEPAVAASLEILTRRARARRIAKRRRLGIRLRSSAPLTDVRAALDRRKRRLGRGRLEALDGNGRVRLRFSRSRAKRLRPGRYGLTVSGRDPHGRTVGTAIRFRLRR